MGYEWDETKARTNLQKHGIDFADAVAVLEDEVAITIEDDDPDEEHFVTIGTDVLGRLLVVVYSYRGESIRLISARKATQREQKAYQGQSQ
jgi:hypothetical protein